MYKKYQQLPSQFIPKHNHKYQLKKTLINTKFQWLMKYIPSDKEADPKLSRIMKIQQKQTVPFADKKYIREQNICITAKENIKSEQEISLPAKHQKTEKNRPSLSNSKSTADDQIFMDKHKLRNRCFSRNITRSKKAATFFEKENQGDEGGSITKLQRCKKLKTVGSLQRSKTKMEIRTRYEKEPFVLSPWMFTEENIDNSEQFKF